MSAALLSNVSIYMHSMDMLRVTTVISLQADGLTVEQLERETGVDESQLGTRIRLEDVSDRISGFAGSSFLVSVHTY